MVASVAFAPGTLERTPLIYLLASILDRQLTGTLVLETGAGAKSAIGFVNGTPNKVKTAESVERLGALLVEHGFLDDATRERSYADAKNVGALHGHHLVEAGLITAEMLECALRTQLLRKLQWIGLLPTTTAYGFYENQDFLARWSGDGARVSPLLAVWHLVRTSSALPNFGERLERLAVQPLALVPAAHPGAFGFDLAEYSVIEAMAHAPQPLAALRRINGISDSVLQRIIYVLSLTRHLEFQGDVETAGPLGVDSVLLDAVELLKAKQERPRSVLPTNVQASAGESTPAAGAPMRAVATSVADGAELSERGRHILELARKYEQMDYYELLGVARDASSSQIQVAFLEAAKRYHPDKLGAEGSELRAVSAKVFARVMEARDTLSDASLREQYNTKLGRGAVSPQQNGQDEQQRIHDIVNAATSFQKAEVFFKKRMFAEAEKEARRAYEADPEQADYLALLAWINANKPDSADLLPEALSQLNTAVRMSPEHEKARFYRAQVLSRLGRNTEALADYRFVVGKNPHNIDAQRELRLWDMRQKKVQTGGFGSRDSAGRSSQNFTEGNNPLRRTSPGHSTTPAPASAQQAKNPASSKGGVFSKLFKK